MTTFSGTSNDQGTAPGWRVGREGRDGMWYEERHDGVWQRIEVQGEMLMGRAHHVIYFDSIERWRQHPAWARGRRDEIIARIKSVFRAPDYEYSGDDAGTTEAAREFQAGLAPDGSGSNATSRPRVPRPPVSGLRALRATIMFSLAVSAGFAVVVVRGLTYGTTRLPIRNASLMRIVTRAEEPGLYWTSVAVYAAISLGMLAIVIWGSCEARRLDRKRF